ncbi:hypothetical protein D2V08_09730 [Flagellimonas lutimaris]|uniref:PH domain-containing protein n=1 Tax=Flagellimonas lutimaris TaxID=475082 RepID=A0A3A1N753_9FLAO|nr:hypothetical protein [Allomuricauda lutimaris]RIV34295.1 hypothetical protein D2V08_09730 [Allomuricauda lutimaris]
MNESLNIQKNLIIFGIPILIVGILVLIAKSSFFEVHPNRLSIGITIDLLLTVPVIYLMLIRKTSIPKTTVVPIIIVGMLICSIILPEENQFYLELFKTWILPIVELSIVSYIIHNVSKAVKQYKSNKNESADFFTTLKTTCYEMLPKIAVIPFVTEISVFYYGFVYWKKRELDENEFSYHKESGTITLLIAIIFIVAIETFVLHTLLTKWSNVAAWILTSVSVYSGVQLLGFLKSMYKRPILIKNGKLFLRYGIMNETIISIDNINSIELSSKDIELNKETRKLSFLGELESHNIIIRLKEENILTGLYGTKCKYRNLVLHVDKNAEFKDLLETPYNKELR